MLPLEILSWLVLPTFTYIFVWVRKLDSNSLTKTKNWSGRNEVTETSGRLHPLWPQDKRLHTPRTTDYRYTRQDRCIQTELAFTLAKNATKPNPFEIIPLQTTRKKNNWKTEEALARAAVTLETERIKGSNPWCLWWWWWWWWWINSNHRITKYIFSYFYINTVHCLFIICVKKCILLLLLLMLFTTVEFSLGGSSPYTSNK